MGIIERVRKHGFLFQELVKRDFKKKYKGTVLGVAWSMLAPLLQLAVMNMIFKNFFGRAANHWIVYLFTGNLMFSYFREATTSGMTALASNTAIFSKVNVPKYLFLLSKNVESLINLAFSMIIYFIFVAADGIRFQWIFLAILFPFACEIVFNIGMGLILSALHMFFKDISYLYNVVCQVLMYMSAVFYYVDTYSPIVQRLFYLNPVYCYITYVRRVIIDGVIPPLWLHGLCLGYALVFSAIGAYMYHKNNYKFLYYV